MNTHAVRMTLSSLAVAVSVGSLLGGCGAVAAPAATPVPSSPAPVITRAAAVATPATAASSTPASPATSTDEALMADIDAIWGGTADAAKVAALYAPDATFHDLVDRKTYTGLEAIQAKAAANASAGFTCAQTSESIRQGDFVAVFHRFSAGGATYPVLAVFELKDGKVVNQWAYPAP